MAKLRSSCEFCRYYHRKCSGELTGCSSCKRHGQVCEYRTRKRRRGKFAGGSDEEGSSAGTSGTSTRESSGGPEEGEEGAVAVVVKRQTPIGRTMVGAGDTEQVVHLFSKYINPLLGPARVGEGVLGRLMRGPALGHVLTAEENMLLCAMSGHVLRASDARYKSVIQAAMQHLPDALMSSRSGASEAVATAQLLLAGLHVGTNEGGVRQHVTLGWAAMELAAPESARRSLLLARSNATSDLTALMRAFGTLRGSTSVGISLTSLGPGDAKMVRRLFGCTFSESTQQWSPMPPVWWAALQSGQGPLVEGLLSSTGFPASLPARAHRLATLISSAIGPGNSNDFGTALAGVAAILPSLELAADLLRADVASSAPRESLPVGVFSVVHAGMMLCSVDLIKEYSGVAVEVGELAATIRSVVELRDVLVYSSGLVAFLYCFAAVVALAAAEPDAALLALIADSLAGMLHDPLAAAVADGVEEARAELAAAATTTTTGVAATTMGAPPQELVPLPGTEGPIGSPVLGLGSGFLLGYDGLFGDMWSEGGRGVFDAAGGGGGLFGEVERAEEHGLVSMLDVLPPLSTLQ